MSDNEDFVRCDMCGRTAHVWIRFCALCGLDYCDQCKMTHDAQHGFVAEAMGEEP
jgi:ribosomal protein L37E